MQKRGDVNNEPVSEAVALLCPFGAPMGKFDKTGFTNVALKSLIAAYPPEFFNGLKRQPCLHSEADPVRTAFLTLMAVVRGEQKGSEESMEELHALYVACAEYAIAQGEEHPFYGVFAADGSVEKPLNAHDFLTNLMAILKLGTTPDCSGRLVEFVVPDQERLHDPLPECLVRGFVKEPGFIVKQPKTSGLVVHVVPGDPDQTVQGESKNYLHQ